MISFGNAGVALADEQSSTHSRKYNVAEKLKLLDDSYVYGGSGPSDCIREIYNLAASELKKILQERTSFPLSDVYSLIQQVSIAHRRNLKDVVLKSNLGITLDEFIAGILARTGNRIDESVIKTAGSMLQQVDNEARMQIILGGLLEGKFEIYQIDSVYGGTNISRPYHSIGSGAEESERILSRYIANLPREKRDSIDKNEGLVKIIEATNASTNLNIGVGGSPSIVYITPDNKPIKPRENQCILASEIVEGFTNGLLDQDFVYGAVANLVYDNGSFETIEEEMKKRAKDWKRLDRILRGYKE